MQEHVLVGKDIGSSAHWLLGRSGTLSSLLRAMAAGAAGPAHAQPATACHKEHAQPLRSMLEHAGGASDSQLQGACIHTCFIAMPNLGMGVLSPGATRQTAQEWAQQACTHCDMHMEYSANSVLCMQAEDSHKRFLVLVRARRA